MKTQSTMERIKERQKLSWEGMFYSIQRIDLLVISISGAGIYVCLETLKFNKENCMDIGSLIKISGCFFLIAIIVNFISQVFGRNSNYYDYLWCEEKINSENNPNEKQQKRIKKYDKLSEHYSNAGFNKCMH